MGDGNVVLPTAEEAAVLTYLRRKYDEQQEEAKRRELELSAYASKLIQDHGGDPSDGWRLKEDGTFEKAARE